MKKVAVVLFNLGGPDARESIKPFLYNFFMDPNIIRVPTPLRRLIAWAISNRRSKKQAGDSYARLGDKSPLLENTVAQAQALAQALNSDQTDISFSVHVCMRYWHPMSDEVVKHVARETPDQIILLPLYPQFSTTTTWSSLGAWQKACADEGLDVPTALICCYPIDNGFVSASAALVRAAYDEAVAEAKAQGIEKAPRMMFSAHGLPKSVIRDGDPYQWQCEQTAAVIAKEAGLADADWQICYQSRVGPMKWIGPSTEEALERAAHDKVPVVIYPHAFVSEHVETLVEIEEEYREMAEHMGVPYFKRVSTVSVQPLFIDGLKKLVLSRLGTTGIAPDVGGRICPAGFTDCCMAKNVTLPHAKACNVQAPTHTLDTQAV